MDIRLLGAVQVSTGPSPIHLGPPRNRAVLARLALEPGRTVAVDGLVEDLWYGEPPRSATKMVHIAVSHLRKALPEGVLATRAPGYVLLVAAADVDVGRFSALHRRGAAALAAGDARAAVGLLREALALWQGEALAGLDEPFAAGERALLDERRLACLEDRVDAELALGTAGLEQELEPLIARNPLRERFQGQAMVALYRAGRQADALDAYRRFRERLGDELGLQPSLRLRDLERAILQQDPALMAPAPGVGSAAAPAAAIALLDADERAAARRPPRARAAIDRPGEIRYARSGDASIAFQVVGDGDFDLVLVPGFISHMELLWEEPSVRRFFGRLASFSRLVLFDKREQGLSDRLGRAATLEESMADMLAVMDAAGSRRAAVFGISEGAPLTIAFAGAHPQRTSALIVYGGFARFVGGDDYPEGMAPERLDRLHRELIADWGGPSMLQLFAPGLVDDVRFRAWWSRLLRSGTSPRGVELLVDFHRSTDVRGALPGIRAPALVLHRRDDPLVPISWGRTVADGIPGSRMVELTGADHLWMAGDQDELLGPVEEFLTGRRTHHQPSRVLQTVLFTDIAGSTRLATELGDQRWRDLLADHDDLVRGEIERFGGRLVKRMGDGTMSAFDSPARAIRAGTACLLGAEAVGLRVRGGLHTGECHVAPDGDLSGVAVHIAARVGAAAAPGELLVSSTVRDLVAGSGLGFTPRGVHTLAGVDGEWALFAADG